MTMRRAGLRQVDRDEQGGLGSGCRVDKDATWLDVPGIMSSVGARELDFDRYNETWSSRFSVILADSMHQPVPTDRQ